MGIEIIGKLTQKNNGDFKLVDLENVDYDGTGKNAKQEIEKKIEDAKNSLDAPTIKSDIQDLKDNKINLIEDETSMEGIDDTEFPTLTTQDKTLIGSINEVNSQYKDIVKTGINSEAVQNKITQMAQDGTITFNTVTPEMTTFINIEKSKNLFNKNEVIPNAFFYKTSDGKIEMDTDNRYACFKVKITVDKNYTVTATGFSTYFSPLNSNIAESYSIKSGTTTLNLIPGNQNRQGEYMAYISFRQDNNPISSYMMVEGDTLPATYIPFSSKKTFDEEIGLSEKYINTILSQADLEQVNGKKYFIGTGGDYNTLTECLKALKDDVNKKIIYMYPGEYNIYEEIGGSTFGLSIADTTTSWRDVSVIVPENTSIIGLGKVTLKFFPSTTEISSKGAQLLSCLNVVHKNFKLENVEIICGNCRYAVHDETGGDAPHGKHIYKNVTMNKQSTSLGMSQAFGCGFSAGEVLEFDNCYFYASRLPFTCHNNGTLDVDNAIIKINNCIFDSANTDNTIRFGNTDSNQVEVKVNFNSCYIKNGIDIKNESSTERPNAFNLILLNSGNPTITISTATNIYEPKIFTI